VVVQQVPTGTTTRQYVFPQDKALIDCSPSSVCSSTGTGNLAGTVYFRLYDSLVHCTADLTNETSPFTPSATGLLFQTSAAISGAAPKTATTGNQTSVRIDSTQTGAVYWHVFYHSTNTAQLDSSRGCAENTTVTFGGDDTTISLP